MGEKSKIAQMEKPDSFWRNVYIAVAVTNLLVIAALWAFSRHFA